MPRHFFLYMRMKYNTKVYVPHEFINFLHGPKYTEDCNDDDNNINNSPY